MVFLYLYVEDNDEIRDGIAAIMEAEHREIITVPDANAALEAASSRHFDVLVTDVGLPGMSGTELARHWLRDDSSRYVLLLSGYEFRRGLGGIGPNVRALLKSCDPEDLEAMLKDIEAAIGTPGKH